MNEHLQTASAQAFEKSSAEGGNNFRTGGSRSGIEFSRREIIAWASFFGFVLILLLIVLGAGKYFMLN